MLLGRAAQVSEKKIVTCYGGENLEHRCYLKYQADDARLHVKWITKTTFCGVHSSCWLGESVAILYVE